MDEPASISRPPTPGELFRDRCFRGLTFGFAWLVVLVVVLVIWQNLPRLPNRQSRNTDLLP